MQHPAMSQHCSHSSSSHRYRVARRQFLCLFNDDLSTVQFLNTWQEDDSRKLIKNNMKVTASKMNSFGWTTGVCISPLERFILTWLPNQGSYPMRRVMRFFYRAEMIMWIFTSTSPADCDWLRYVAQIGAIRDVWSVLVGKRDERKYRCWKENNIKMDLRKSSMTVWTRCNSGGGSIQKAGISLPAEQLQVS
jgi:hypothetical protein